METGMRRVRRNITRTPTYHPLSDVSVETESWGFRRPTRPVRLGNLPTNKTLAQRLTGVEEEIANVNLVLAQQNKRLNNVETVLGCGNGGGCGPYVPISGGCGPALMAYNPTQTFPAGPYGARDVACDPNPVPFDPNLYPGMPVTPGACGPNVWNGACGPNVCGPNACGPNTWNGACGPNACGPNACGPNVCGPNVCGPNTWNGTCGPNTWNGACGQFGNQWGNQWGGPVVGGPVVGGPWGGPGYGPMSGGPGCGPMPYGPIPGGQWGGPGCDDRNGPCDSDSDSDGECCSRQNRCQKKKVH